MRLVALVLLGSPLVAAGDAKLETIHSLLVPMRNSGIKKVSGATPAFTAIKHQLRDLIEPRFSVLQWEGSRWIPDPVVLQEQINEELNQADLFCYRQPITAC